MYGERKISDKKWVENKADFQDGQRTNLEKSGSKPIKLSIRNDIKRKTEQKKQIEKKSWKAMMVLQLFEF